MIASPSRSWLGAFNYWKEDKSRGVREAGLRFRDGLPRDRLECGGVKPRGGKPRPPDASPLEDSKPDDGYPLHLGRRGRKR